MRLSGLPAVVVASKPSNWTSNRLISPNLQAAYRKLWGDDYRVYKLTPNADVFETRRVARLIASRRHDRLIFVDHLPHPGKLLEAVAQKGRALPILDFHLYGDFTLHLRNWRALEPLLRKTPVRWICASERQAALVKRLISGAARSVAVCPFPVDASQFSFDPQLRERARARLGLARDERALLYTGRFSLQKNSVRLLREAARFIATSPSPTRLLLAGSFDDLGAPFFGVRQLPGYYFQLWNRMLKSLPARVSRRIHYFGRLDSAQLRELYHAADCYFSLSLHHDEDFGMAPAEALSCGGAAVLTDWGGYTSFVKASSVCRLIPVTRGRAALEFSSNAVQEALRAACAEETRPEERLARASRFLSRFSVDAASEILRTIHRAAPPRFVSFDGLMSRLCAGKQGPLYFPGGPGKNTLYPRLYGAYYSPRMRPSEVLS